MPHIIESEKLATVHFKKELARESSIKRGYKKSLIMSIGVDHYKNYIVARYTVEFIDYARREDGEPIIREWEFSMIDLAVDKYNELGR